MNAPRFLPAIPPDHAQALQRVTELEHELQALRNLVVLADVALESVGLELTNASDALGRYEVASSEQHRGRRMFVDGVKALQSARHELGATRRSLGVVR